MATHLSFNTAGHSRVSEILLAGRTGYWPCDPAKVESQGWVKLYERHPEGGGFELNDTVNAPWVATVKVTRAYRIQWLDKVRTIIEFDPSTLTTEYITTMPSFNAGGVWYDPEPEREE